MKRLTFEDSKDSAMEKQIPMKPVEQLTSDKPIENAQDLEDATKVKLGTLYRGILYTVVPKEFDLAQDITPDVQGFDKKNVILWDNYDQLFKFDLSLWKKVEVRIDKSIVGKRLFKPVSDVYEIDYVPKEWIKEAKTSPQYTE